MAGPVQPVSPLARSLEECEAVIERGLATFIEVGQALLEIRDSRLYRESHGTFEDYCRERWGFSRVRAHQLIEGAEVAVALTTVNSAAPTNEAQARELAPLKNDPPAMREALEQASEDGPPTAAKVREVVRAREPIAPRALVSSRKWAQKIEQVSAQIPYVEFTDEELADAYGAAEFLFLLLKGETITRKNKREG